jgi:hypothetical protein
MSALYWTLAMAAIGTYILSLGHPLALVCALGCVGMYLRESVR